MVGKLFKTGGRFFSSKQNSILSAAFILMMAVMISRVLGLVRNRLLAGTFFGGQEWQLDAYYAAFTLPDMIFQLIVLGALSSAFIPVYSSYLKKNEDEAWQISYGVITLAIIGFSLLSIVIFIFAYPLSSLIAPNFPSESLLVMTKLTRVMLLAQLFFLVSNFFTGILQSHQRFLLPAIAPILYNLGIISGIVLLAPQFGIYGPAIGVVVGALLHLLVQLPLVKKIGFAYKPRLGLNLKGVRKIGKLMIPRTLALAVSQIEAVLAVFLGSAMVAGSISIFNFAQSIYALPIGLFGLTIGQAAFPMLSKETDDESNLMQFKNLFLSSFKQILYLTLPSSALLLVLRVPLVRIVVGAKTFPWEATLLTSQAVAILALSVAAQAVIQLLVRSFYALQDTKTPLFIGMVSVLTNVVLSFYFVNSLKFGVIGLALSFTLAGIFQAILLFSFLNKKIHYLPISEWGLPIFKMLIATVLTGVSLWLPMRLLDRFILDTTRTINLLVLTVVAGACGFIVYLVFSKILQIKELDQFLKIFEKFGAWRKVFDESEEVLAEPSAISQSAPLQE
ncbi:murein biosynthesis integral membrane protein MurJ [Candidatus Beckwithbacteria bacterium]|nr:murein biosynthesis integral membrane protein MurJ [Candidatus Beckwithbacteria bacterium]